MNTQDIQDIYELSPLQQGMLFHVLYEPESRLYFEQIVIPFEGSVNLQAFADAWNVVVAANTALRTSFHWEETEKPVQVVHKHVTVPVETKELLSLEGPGREAEMDELLAADRQRGFDMQRAPLLRITHLRSGNTSRGLLFSFHHLILDGWSLQMIFRQFSEAYEALCLGQRPVTPQSRPYSDYIRWLQKQDLKAAREYWRKAFAGVDQICRLPSDAGGEVNADAFTELAVELSEEATTGLREFAARHKLTLNTLVQGAWALLVQRLTGCDDVVFGVTVSGRPAELQDVENVVGLFINTVPLRVQVDYDANVANWLSNLQREQFEARQFDYTPLVLIREWIEIAGPGPLFDTLLAFENYPVQAKAMGAAAPATFVERTNYPLSAAVVPGQRLQTRLLYNRTVLSPETVARAGEQFNLILESLSAGDDQRIGSLATLTAKDRELFAALNDTQTDYPSEKTVVDLWHQQVARAPQAIAVEFGSRSLTYLELDRLTNQLAASLRARGVGSESPVGIRIPRSIEFIEAALGILKAGGTYVPLDLAYPPERVDHMLDDLGVRIVLTSAQTPNLAITSAVQMLSVEDLLAPPAAPDSEPLMPASTALNAAYVMYTSGSTGRPKGITITHRGIVSLVQKTNYIDVLKSERIGHMSNCGFDAATFEIWAPLLNGATLVGIDPQVALSPLALAAELRERRISVLFVTTALFNQTIAEAPDAFGSLRVLFFGGEAVDPRSVRAALKAGPPQNLCHMYGPTECTTYATWHRVESLDPQATNIPIGRPVSNTTVYVLNRGLDLVAPGSTGELYIGGEGLARAYNGEPAFTAERFLPDPYSSEPGSRMYRTGDKVRWRLDGSIDFVGRFDSQVKIRGYRIELGEIERRLQEHSQVRQAAAIVRTDNTGDHSLVAYFVPNGALSDDFQHEVRSMLRKYLPEYMLPAVIHPISALPLTEHGKINYHALPVLELAPAEWNTPFLEARNPIEQKLASIWQQVLGRDRVGVNDVFLDIGGHSLRATQLVSRIRREFNIEIQLRTIFEKPTIAELAELLTQDSNLVTAPEAAISRVRRDESRRVRA
jgi:amino acid adenylation domain-containing protein